MNEVGLIVTLIIIFFGVVYLLYAWRHHRKEHAHQQLPGRLPKNPTVINNGIYARTDFPQTAAEVETASILAGKPLEGAPLFKDRLRDARANGLAPVEALEKAIEFDPDIEDREAFEACMIVGYTAKELLMILSQRGNTLEEMVEEVNQWYDLNFSELAAVLLPYATGDSLKDRGRAVIQAIKSVHDDFDPTEVTKQLIDFGCSPADTFSLCFEETETEFGKLFMTLRDAIPLDVELAAKISKELKVDPSDEDTYSELRNEDVPYEYIVQLMRLRGETLSTILDCEVIYSGNAICDDARDLKDCGFTATEIVEAVIDSNDPPSYADIIEMATDLDMSYPEIGTLLKKKEIDPEDLEDDLKDLDFTDRIRLFYAMIKDEPAK